MHFERRTKLPAKRRIKTEKMRYFFVRKKTAIITGGAEGIGRRTAFQLAEAGVNLVINYRSSKERAEQLCKLLSEKFGTINIAAEGDITQYEACERVVQKACEYFSGVDILIHNAGPYIRERKDMVDYSIDEWDYVLKGNLYAVFYLSKLVIPYMRKQQWGRIITIGFDRVETAPGWIYRSAFASAKTGVASLTRTIALEEAQYGITANMISPGDIIEDWKESDIKAAIHAVDSQTPVGRQGTGEDISRVVAFLADEKSSFITGSIIPVTGGKDVLGKVHREL